MPVGMCAQLFETLIVFVNRVEEGDRIGDVDQHRQTEFRRRLPDRIEALVIDRDQFALMVFDVQPERFPDFQSLCAATCLFAQPSAAHSGKPSP